MEELSRAIGLATDVFSSAEEVAMPLDFEKLAEVMVALMISSSILLVAAAIAWRRQ